ncbi:MAG: flavodoxin family protein [Methanothrix sp.]|nr:flavodoxin family protein [Methanothrix sp.]
MQIECGIMTEKTEKREKMKVVAFNGSPRRDGNTATLLGVVLKELNDQGIETELVHLKGPISGCIACNKCFEKHNGRCAQDKDIVNLCIQKMALADGIILGSPTYFADLTPELKALIDRSGFVAKANGDLFKRKVGAAVVAVRRAGAIHVFDSINHFFLISQMIIAGSSYWNIGLGLAEKDVLGDEEAMAIMRTLGQNIGWLLKKIKD